MLRCVVSGGQTGVDRGVLRAATDCGLVTAGWCPRGRRAEDGIIPSQFALLECWSDRYAVRTGLNLRDADATLIVAPGRLAGGTRLTRKLAAELGRSCKVTELNSDPVPAIVAWIEQTQTRVLNVAGPRESESPGIEAASYRWLRMLFQFVSSTVR